MNIFTFFQIIGALGDIWPALKYLSSLRNQVAGYKGVISKKWIANLLSNTDNMNIVYGYTHSPTFDIIPRYSKESIANLPNNVYLIGLHESFGIWEMAQKITAWGGIKNISYIAHENYDITSNLPTIIVGGASINSQTGRILEYIDSGFRVEYPEHILIDEIRNVELRPEITNNFVTTDYGYFLVLPRSPFSNTRLIVTSGVWPLGSLGAQRFLLNPTKEFIESGRNYLQNKEPFLCVLEVRASEGTIAEPRVMYHRSITLK